MNPRTSHLPLPLTTSERNCLAQSLLSSQEEEQGSAILRAAVATFGFPGREGGHPNCGFSALSLAAAQRQSNVELSVMAHMRSNQAFAALRYANLGSYSTVRATNIAEDATIKSHQKTPLSQFKVSTPTTPSAITMPRPCESAEQIMKDSNAEALETLGAKSLERRKQKSQYFDASTLRDPGDTETAAAAANRKSKGGVTEPFPEKLYRMLEEAKLEGKEDVISFFPHGRSFGIHSPERFAEEIMPKFFKQSRVSSFQCQLNLYGFTRINTGPDAGGYYHELFLRGRPALGGCIRRVGVPQAVPRKRGVKAHGATLDPDFYNMSPIIIAPKHSDSKR